MDHRGGSSADPAQRMEEAAAAALSDPGWFASAPCPDYVLRDGRLTFPSQIETPHTANNTVQARYFPAESGDRRRAVLVLPQWNADAGAHAGLCRFLARVGDQRPPPEPAVSRCPHAAGARTGRLYRQRQHRPHAAGESAGGPRRPPGGRVAGRAGPRPHRHSGHQPRVVPGLAHRRARAAGQGRGPQPRLAVLRRRRLGRPVHRARARRPRRGHRRRPASPALAPDQSVPLHRAAARHPGAPRVRAVRSVVPGPPVPPVSSRNASAAASTRGCSPCRADTTRPARRRSSGWTAMS